MAACHSHSGLSARMRAAKGQSKSAFTRQASGVLTRVQHRTRVSAHQPHPGSSTAEDARTNGQTSLPIGASTSEVTSHDVKDLQAKLLSLIAGTNRGAIASLATRRRIQRLVDDLVVLNQIQDVAVGTPSLIQGEWELIYSTAQAFRSSPFFSAFQQGLVKDTDASAAIFAFTDAIPGAQVGRAVQDIDVAASALVSKVDLTLFPGISGTIITESSLTVSGQDLHLTVQSTRVAGSNVFLMLDDVEVPVKDLFERIRGVGATAVTSRVLYLDSDLRIDEAQEGEVFVYRRLP